MNNGLLNLDQDQIEKITGFAQQVKAVKHIKQIKGPAEKEPEQIKKSASTDTTPTQEQFKYLKSIPKDELQKLGFGDLDFESSEDFLSESSFSESDFQLLRKDNFFELIQDIQNDLAKKGDLRKKKAENKEKAQK